MTLLTDHFRAFDWTHASIVFSLPQMLAGAPDDFGLVLSFFSFDSSSTNVLTVNDPVDQELNSKCLPRRLPAPRRRTSPWAPRPVRVR